MAIEAINNSNNNKTKSGYGTPVALGSLAGYSAKWMIPVTQSEKDEFYKLELKKIKEVVRKEKANKIEKIKRLNPKTNKGVNEFIAVYTKRRDKLNIKRPYSRDFLELRTSVNTRGAEVKELEMQKLNTFVKSIRSSGAFIGIGATVGLLFALINNTNSSKKSKN